MKLWCVNYATLFSYNTYSKIFLCEEDARKFYESRSENCHRSISSVSDIWNWCARNFEEVLKLIMDQHLIGKDNCSEWVYNVSTLTQDIIDEMAEDGIDVRSVILKKTHESSEDNISNYSLSVVWMYNDHLYHKLYTFKGVCE